MSMRQQAMPSSFERWSWFKNLNRWDGLWAVVVLASAFYDFHRYGATMNTFEIGILSGTSLGIIGLGWFWKSFRGIVIAVTLVSLWAISLYGTNLALGEQNFFLRFLISSQSAIMWMSALFVLATVTYFYATFSDNEFAGKVATSMTWTATAMGLIGLMVRWRESYLMGADIGHIPVSNLYEVFILFSVITALLYLYYEQKYQTRKMGGFVLLIISAAVAFLLWYSFTQGASEIKPLVPALQSYWMKIHVPANFVGYGSFAIAAMLGVAYLLKQKAVQANPDGYMAKHLPDLDMLDDVMHKSIALGFAFFTLATVLGAMWAADAWGGYWSWDPKETWALIVWLNYAAWLHMRLTKGWRGTPLAWWAVVGLLVTTFAFLGVNMFLSGLHSYGGL